MTCKRRSLTAGREFARRTDPSPVALRLVRAPDREPSPAGRGQTQLGWGAKGDEKGH